MDGPRVDEKAEAGPPAAEEGAAAVAPTMSLLRVPAEKVSRLMDLVGELSLSVSELIRSPDLEGLDLSEFEKAAHRLKMVVREVQDAAAELRLVPVGDVFRRVRRMARELERDTGKKIAIALEGEDTAIDKAIVDRLYEPLVHAVRNSADHGIEMPQERAAAGKPETGTITLSAAQVGGDIHITIGDDGQGLNRARILARARQNGLVGANEDPGDQALWKMIFQAGFSTAAAVTRLSGRGVGMDVLQTVVTELRGRIGVETIAGRGTKIGLSIPLTLAFLESLVMRVGPSLYAVPIDVVAEIFRPDRDQVTAMSAEQGAEVVRVRDEFVPICRLQHFFSEGAEDLRKLEELVIVVLNTSAGQIGLPVDEVFDQQQVVMKPLQGQLARIRGSFGCALLANGSVGLLLDCERLAEGMRRP
ncbi:MAG: chemotaxis protein CheW [Polyangiaceae bacterium]|jgi:two-component system chemotaxis sensor kinase CheA